MQFDYRLPLRHTRNDSDHRVIQVTNILAGCFHNTVEYPAPPGSSTAPGCYHREQQCSNTNWPYLELPDPNATDMYCPTLPCGKQTFLCQAKAIKWEHSKAVIFIRQKPSLLFSGKKKVSKQWKCCLESFPQLILKQSPAHSSTWHQTSPALARAVRTPIGLGQSSSFPNLQHWTQDSAWEEQEQDEHVCMTLYPTPLNFKGKLY